MANTTTAKEVPTVFVCSATGTQGGAVARMVLDMGWRMHATTRNLAAPAALTLKSRGVHLTQGDWDNLDALEAGIAGCDKLFLCLYPNLQDPFAESKQARKILAIAKDAGVKQVVASTSFGVAELDNQDHVKPGSFMEKHLRGKLAVEEAVTDASFASYTFLRPAFFMANFLEPKCARYPEPRDKGTWTTTLLPETFLPLIDHEDIARFTLAAFQDPEGLNGHALNLASELLPAQRIMDELADAAGRPGAFKAIFLTEEEGETLGSSNALINATRTMRAMSEYVELEELRKYATLTTFREFLHREKTSVNRTWPQ